MIDTLPALHQGDIFCVGNPSAKLGRYINRWQIHHSWDRKSTYTHTGIITHEDGRTFESGIPQPGEDGWWIGEGSLWNYCGSNILIIRHFNFTPEIFYRTFPVLQARWEGKRYPIWRLPLFAAGLAGMLHNIDIPVCSETSAALYTMAGFLPAFWGVYPDMLADLVSEDLGPRRGWIAAHRGIVPGGI